MNILNQSPAKGQPAFPARGPGSRHPPPDACQHLLPVGLPLPASNALRSFQPSRSATRTPLVIANGGSPPREGPYSRDDHGTTPLKTTTAQGHSSSATIGSMDDICDTSQLLDSSGEDQYLKFEPCTALLGLVRSLMQDTKFGFLRVQEEPNVVGSDHVGLFPPEPLTLAVSVSSAVKLESKQMDRIANKMRRLTGFKNLRLENTVDPSLIAGFVISYGVGDAHVIDLSMKGRLAMLEAQLQLSDQSTAEGWRFPTRGEW